MDDILFMSLELALLQVLVIGLNKNEKIFGRLAYAFDGIKDAIAPLIKSHS